MIGPSTGPVRVAVLGAGARGGETYGTWLLRNADRGQIVAVADSRRDRLARLADRAGLPPGDRFDDWRALLTAVGQAATTRCWLRSWTR